MLTHFFIQHEKKNRPLYHHQPHQEILEQALKVLVVDKICQNFDICVKAHIIFHWQ